MSTTAAPRHDLASSAHLVADPTGAAGLIDPRGPRWAAGVSAAVLAGVLLAPPSVAPVLLGAQAAVFAVGAVAGVRRTPYAWLFRTLVRPRLAAPAELEDPRPPRFAQAVGLAFTLLGLVALLAGATVTGQAAVGLAVVAALLNAATGLCLGCEGYLLARRLTTRAA